jgi:hypothetical protein
MSIRKSSPSPKERGIQGDTGYKFPVSLSAAEIWFVPHGRSFPGSGAVVDPQFPLRPGPPAMDSMKPGYKASASPAGTHLDESAAF